MSYKVIIVDDEPLIARSISRIISKINPLYTISAICHNGKEALKYIEEDIPDLVITDVQMPVMNGLELAHYIHIHFPAIHVVILSGYNEFQYAQQAIHEGVKDYLLKPLNHEQVSTLLSSLQKELEISHQCKQNDLWYQQLNFSNSMPDTKEVKKYLPYNTYLLMLTCCGPYFHSTSTPSEEICVFWKSNYLFQSCWKLLDNIPFWIIDSGRPNEKLIIISCENTETLTTLELTCTKLHQLFCNDSFPVTTVITTYHTDCTSFSDIAIKMHQHLRQYLLFGYSSYHIIDKESPAPSAPSLSFYLTEDKRKLIPMLFTEKQQQKLHEIISSILFLLRKNKCTQLLLEKFMERVITIILSEAGLDSSLFLYQNMIYDLTASTFDYEKLESSYLKILDELFELQSAIHYNNMPQNLLVQEVQKYVESHYTEPINVQTIAARFGIVPPYLSKLYFDFYQIPLKKAILLMRINKAEELLKITPPIPLREIAEQTGFTDQFYFSKVFKQQHSISPAEFRKLL